MGRLSLGLDLSTQGLSAVILDIEERATVLQKSLDYRADERLQGFGLRDDYILPPGEPGEANQPILLFLAAIDVMMADLKRDLAEAGRTVPEIAVINVSAQQHGHVLLNYGAAASFRRLHEEGSPGSRGLAEILGGAFSVPFARIWRTSNTGAEATWVRDRVGGSRRLIELSGSDAPLRFSAFGIRKTAKTFPEEYVHAKVIHQLNSLVVSVLTGKPDVPLDFGNACGTSLMHYTGKSWSGELLSAVAEGLPGGSDGLQAKLPRLASGRTLAGGISSYFVERYGFSPLCRVGVGSGDNPQAKVLVAGSLLSLGTSFVIMAETDGRTLDWGGNGNAMYDALDRPFLFGCRTNGALRWDNVRALHGLSKEEYGPAERALRTTAPGNQGRMFFWQAEEESFPKSSGFAPVRIGYESPDLAADYTGIVESTLACVYLFSRRFTKAGDALYVTGGAAESPAVLRRVAAIWARKVIPIGKAGAALGAAVSGAQALLDCSGEAPPPSSLAESFIERKPAVRPDPVEVGVYHSREGVLQRIGAAYQSVTGIREPAGS